LAYTKPSLRESIKDRIMASGKGGKPGQWSARKAQLLAQAYEKAGGGYSGEKTKSQKSLAKWTGEKWGTKSGKPSTQGPKATGERYLPKKAREALSKKEYAATSAKKRADTKKGKQFSKQPSKIANKTSKYR
jgi:protein involved in polysaccharide export with SLBB domain